MLSYSVHANLGLSMSQLYSQISRHTANTFPVSLHQWQHLKSEQQLRLGVRAISCYLKGVSNINEGKGGN